MRPIQILIRFFGQKDGQSKVEFLSEMKTFRESDPGGYKEVVTLAAAELGVTPDFN